MGLVRRRAGIRVGFVRSANACHRDGVWIGLLDLGPGQGHHMSLKLLRQKVAEGDLEFLRGQTRGVSGAEFGPVEFSYVETHLMRAILNRGLQGPEVGGWAPTDRRRFMVQQRPRGNGNGHGNYAGGSSLRRRRFFYEDSGSQGVLLGGGHSLDWDGSGNGNGHATRTDGSGSGNSYDTPIKVPTPEAWP